VEGVAEIPKTSKRRRKDPVADPSSLVFSGSGRLRKRRNASAVQEQEPKVEILIFLIDLPPRVISNSGMFFNVIKLKGACGRFSYVSFALLFKKVNSLSILALGTHTCSRVHIV
jgi:hypothetical protein